MTSQVAACEPAIDVLEGAEKLILDASCRTNEFLSVLGHEMRNPLSALSYALQAWPLAVQDPVQMEKLRNTIQRQVDQLMHLSDDLLDVARIADGTLHLRREQVELGPLIDGACEEIRPLIDECGHALTVTLPAEPMLVYGDAPRLLQVFANLMQNAAKFTSRNGSLRVTLEPQEGRAEVRVRDNGPGIEPHLQTEIFQGTRAAANAGMGIGLRLVKTIVELHDGSIAVRSEGLGRGTEFIVKLPMMNDAVRRQPAVPGGSGA